MTRSIPATDLRDGMTLALPFGKTATVSAVKVGRSFVNFRTEHGATRVGRYSEITIEVPNR